MEIIQIIESYADDMVVFGNIEETHQEKVEILINFSERFKHGKLYRKDKNNDRRR